MTKIQQHCTRYRRKKTTYGTKSFKHNRPTDCSKRKNYHILNCLCIKLRNESHMYTSASTSADGVPRPTTTSSCTIVCTKLLTTCAVAEIAYTSKLQ